MSDAALCANRDDPKVFVSAVDHYRGEVTLTSAEREAWAIRKLCSALIYWRDCIGEARRRGFSIVVFERGCPPLSLHEAAREVWLLEARLSRLLGRV